VRPDAEPEPSVPVAAVDGGVDAVAFGGVVVADFVGAAVIALAAAVAFSTKFVGSGTYPRGSTAGS